jgi:putative ABC transport system permease protein
MRKNLFRTIKASIGRYLAIVCIIALGASIFVGLLSTKGDMILTGQQYLDQQNMFDLRFLSTYGWSQKEVDAIAAMTGVKDAEGSIVLDVIVRRDNSETDSVFKIHSLPERVSKPYLQGGRMPKSKDECVIDGYGATDDVLGTTITIAVSNSADTLSSFHLRTFTVVGYVSSPLYMDASRGGTTIGNGSVAGYLYLMPEAFDMDVYTEINVTIEGERTIYSDAYNDRLTEISDLLEPDVTILAQDRFVTLKADAEQAYADGWKEYQDGLKAYADGKAEALQKLEDGLKELTDGQLLIDENRQKLEDGLKELEDGQKELDAQMVLLQDSRKKLLDGKAEAYAQLAKAYGELMDNYKSVNDGIKQIDDNLPLLDDGIRQIENGLTQIKIGLIQIDIFLPLKEMEVFATEQALKSAQDAEEVDEALITDLEQRLAAAKAELETYKANKEEALRMEQELNAQLSDLNAQRKELIATRATLEEALEAIDMGFVELQSNQTMVNNQFASAEAQLESGLLQLQEAQATIDAGREELEAGRMELENAQAELDEGWAEYEKGKAEAEKELAEGQQKLDDAAKELADARKAIDEMTDAEVYILDRNSNAGYMAFDSNSDIVAGVARVFPAFFLLVAALVCITTMTRMVEEERTQIGTLKALGYSNGAIIGKYIAYAASAAIVGCGLGVLIGSVIFPMILWDAYCIILNIVPHVSLQINWPLCMVVVGVYTAVILLVTWYCCRRSLKEVAAELIRPKAPTSGKKIFLEYLPFWKYFSFLNKVMLRNVFRYRQRMLMMLIGIGGCTALLLTGFGLRDSIANLVTDQFQNVTTNDLTIYFSEAQTPEQQQAFRDAMKSQTEDILFFYQTSVDVQFEGMTKEIFLVAADEEVKSFMHFTQDGEDLGMPEPGKAFLSVGVADLLDVHVGDTVTLKDQDMRYLTVEISGIYHNSVYNYAIVAPETVESQWGALPGCQMAFATVRDYCDHHEAGAAAGALDGVMNVIVTKDIASQVDSMLEALNTVVITIVLCAGALAMIVLYNLTNINITERIREIATIKVLGFRASETAAYVFKENLLLSAMGVIVGMAGGWYLLQFVMSEIRVDMVWFVATLKPASIILGAVLTMLAACLVDFLLYFKLEKINMAEALKSVE